MSERQERQRRRDGERESWKMREDRVRGGGGEEAGLNERVSERLID